MFSLAMTGLYLLGFLELDPITLVPDKDFWESLKSNGGKYLTQKDARQKLISKFQSKMSEEYVDLFYKLLCGPDEREGIDVHIKDLQSIIRKIGVSTET